MLPPGSSDLPESVTGRHIAFLFGLASDGVYICRLCYQSRGELLPRLSTLTRNRAVYFCCTSLGVTSTGRYPASCPAKPGLSSPPKTGPRTFATLAVSLYTYFFHFVKHNQLLNTISYTLKQLPPTNSLIIEFFGKSSVLTPRK